MPTSKPDPARDALRQAALSLRCPRCGVDAGTSCQSYHGRFMIGLHAERLAEAEGLPSKENRRHKLRRTPGQGRVPWDLTVRELSENDESGDEKEEAA